MFIFSRSRHREQLKQKVPTRLDLKHPISDRVFFKLPTAFAMR